MSVGKLLFRLSYNLNIKSTGLLRATIIAESMTT